MFAKPQLGRVRTAIALRVLKKGRGPVLGASQLFVGDICTSAGPFLLRRVFPAGFLGMCCHVWSGGFCLGFLHAQHCQQHLFLAF